MLTVEMQLSANVAFDTNDIYVILFYYVNKIRIKYSKSRKANASARAVSG